MDPALSQGAPDSEPSLWARPWGSPLTDGWVSCRQRSPPSSVPVSPTPGPKERTGGLQPGSACPARAARSWRIPGIPAAAVPPNPPLCHHGNASCEGQGGWRSSPELVWAEGASSGGESSPYHPSAPLLSHDAGPQACLTRLHLCPHQGSSGCSCPDWLAQASPSLGAPSLRQLPSLARPWLQGLSHPLPGPWGLGTVKGLWTPRVPESDGQNLPLP